MPSSKASATGDGSLEAFVKGVVGEDKLRVEEDLGHGFVRLKSSEAERRQAAQDIRCSEDVVIEMLRNARDAGARNIFLAVQRDDTARSLVIVDDGAGIPEAMRAVSLAKTPHGCLSREVSGICGRTLIVNVPGSPRAAVENLSAVVGAVSHGLAMLRGGTADCAAGA